MGSLNRVVVILLALSIAFLSYFVSQDEFPLLFGVYTFSFLAFLFILYKQQCFSFKQLTVIALLVHLVSLFAVPNLSPDYFRFIWDGELISSGINPFSKTPLEIAEHTTWLQGAYRKEIFAGITELSQANYSCYPSVNQFYFFLGSIFTDNLYLNIIVLRVIMLLTSIVGFNYAVKLLEHFKINKNRIFLVALNPFIVLEFTANLHFEIVMSSFLVIGFYFVITQKLWRAALFLALAINVKLTPFILLPFFFKKLGFAKSAKLYVLTLLIFAISFVALLWPAYWSNFGRSLTLYFNNFEFNSSIFAIAKAVFYPVYDWETILVVGPWLSKISLAIIIVLSLVYKPKNNQDMIRYMLYAYVIYLLFSTTIHPWYVAVPLVLSLFTKHNTFVVWSFLGVLSYVFYILGESSLRTALTILEYVTVIGVLVYELYHYKLTQKS